MKIHKYNTFELGNDSMSPKYPKNTQIVGELIEGDYSELKLRNPYIFVTEDENVFFKTLKSKSSIDITLSSINSSYNDKIIMWEDIIEVWKPYQIIIK